MANIDYGITFQNVVNGSGNLTVTKTATSGKSHYITDVTVTASSANAELQISDTTNGTIYQICMGTTPFSQSFIQPLMGTQGEALVIILIGTLAAATNADVYGSLNVSGFTR